MSLLKTRKPEITEEDIQALCLELEALISEKVTEATDHVLSTSRRPDYFESIVLQALRVRDPVAGAQHILNACQGELAAILFVASQMIAGRVLDDRDDLQSLELRTSQGKPFGKRWREFE